MIRRPPRSTLFPTRRSSDLSETLNSTGGLGNTTWSIASGALPLGINISSAGVLRDRKSTRLNSSHQIISYAVFCLKKKKDTSHSNFSRLRSSMHSNAHPPEL